MVATWVFNSKETLIARGGREPSLGTYDWTRRDLLRRSVTTTAAVLSGPALLTGCSDTPAATALEGARKSGTLKVGFADEAPYGFIGSDGRLTGQAPEVARAVLRSLGIAEIEGVLADFRQLIGGLRAGRYRMIAAGMFITPQRCREVAFSVPDYQVESSFLVPAGNPANISRFEDIRDSDVLIAVMTGAVEQSYAAAAGVPEDKIVLLGDQDSLFRAVRSGRVYGAAILDATAAYLLNENPESGLEKTEPFPGGAGGPGIGAFAFPKQEREFLAAFNDGLRSLKDSGEWLRIVEEFGFGPQHQPPALSAEQLCRG